MISKGSTRSRSRALAPSAIWLSNASSSGEPALNGSDLPREGADTVLFIVLTC